MEQCQEIMTLGQMPYTPKQIINNALHLLMASNIFPMNEFDKWATMPTRTYPRLKIFIHKAYTRKLNAMELCNTSGQMGYAAQLAQHNRYNVLDFDNNTLDNSKGSIIGTITAATTTSSTIGNTYDASAVHPGLTLAISQMMALALSQMHKTSRPLRP
jgi:hypothetical protein